MRFLGHGPWLWSFIIIIIIIIILKVQFVWYPEFGWQDRTRHGWSKYVWLQPVISLHRLCRTDYNSCCYCSGCWTLPWQAKRCYTFSIKKLKMTLTCLFSECTMPFDFSSSPSLSWSSSSSVMMLSLPESSSPEKTLSSLSDRPSLALFFPSAVVKRGYGKETTRLRGLHCHQLPQGLILAIIHVCEASIRDRINVQLWRGIPSIIFSHMYFRNIGSPT